MICRSCSGPAHIVWRRNVSDPKQITFALCFPCWFERVFPKKAEAA